MTVAGTSPALPGGFFDPVQQSQQAFRAMLDALARPGRIAKVAADFGYPIDLAPSLAAILLTLCDLDTRVFLAPGFDDGPVRDWLRFHTGAPVTTDMQQADIILLHGSRLPPLDRIPLGSDEAPEKGATLLIQVQTLDGPAAMECRGPGIKSAERLPMLGLPESFWRQRSMLSSAFPRGADIYFGHGAMLIGLPRSTAISFPEA